MNDAHWHLVVNHFPIIGTILALGTLLTGLLLKNNSIPDKCTLFEAKRQSVFTQISKPSPKQTKSEREVWYTFCDHTGSGLLSGRVGDVGDFVMFYRTIPPPSTSSPR